MATKSDILEALAAESGPILPSALATKMGLDINQITTQITRMVKNGEVTKNEAGEILITEKGKEVVTLPSHVEMGATPYDQFKYLGKKIGILGDLIDVTTDHVWNGGDYTDITWVWNAMGEMGIRPDLKNRWCNAWRTSLKQPVPPELKEQLLAGTEIVEKEEGTVSIRKPGRDYIIVDDEAVRVAEGLGDFTIQEAKDLLGINALRQRFKAPSGAGQTSQMGQPEPLSAILTALQPWLKQDTNMDVVKELLEAKMQLLEQNILSGIPRGSPQQPKSLMEQLIDLVGNLGRLKEVGPVLRSILGIPESSGNPNPTTFPLPFKDKDGNPTTLTADPDTAIKWLGFLGEERRADEKHEMLRGTVQTIQQEWPPLVAALKETAEGYNKMASQAKGREAPETEAPQT